MAEVMSPSEVEAALGEVQAILQADGYDLRVHPDIAPGGSVTLEIVAGEGACADCLVPRDVLEGIIGMHLADGVSLDLIYPSEAVH